MARAPKSSEKPSDGRTPFDLFGPGAFWAVQHQLERGEYVDGKELALVLRKNPGKALPDPIREYMIRWFEGEVKRPRGRRPGGAVKELRDALAYALYREYLEQFQREVKSIRKAAQTGRRPRPPHFRAAEQVACELFPNHTAAYVLNLVSRKG
jgi:hypothetical protein